MDSCYAPLHLRSNYSLLAGTARLEEIVATALHRGFIATALTDVNNLYGAIPFYKLACEAGVKPIIGVDLVHESGRAILLARNLAGYSNLCRIISRRNLDESFRVDEALARFSEGLFILTEDVRLAETLADKVARRSLWLALMSPPRSETSRRGVEEASRRLGVRMVAVAEANFLEPGDYELHRVVTAIRENALVAQLAPADMAHPESYLASDERMRKLYRDYPEALASTREIAEACNLEIPMGKPIFPKCELPEGKTAAGFLKEQCRAGLAWRYVTPKREAVERLERELDLIERLGFSEYFVVVGDIVRFARSIGVPTVGRGSGAGSIVSYLLGITNVDPIEFNLPFERFLNVERADCPDLDIDLCWRLRDEVIDYVYRTHGADRVAMIATHNMFGPQSAFREVAKAMGIPNDAVNRISRRIPYYESVEVAAQVPGLTVDPETLKRVAEYARRIEGFPHHLSIHCGGIVIADREIDSYVPVERASKGIVITQYEMNGIEDIGLVKIDLLGNRALSTIRQTVEIIREVRGLRVNPEEFADRDAETIRMLQRGGTLGCCQLESPAMRHLLVMLRPDSVKKVVQALALIRPAPASVGMKEVFIRRARGLEPTRFDHPSLASVLGDTYGIMLYEDDAMLVASTLAGLTLEQGDQLRKVLKKARTREQLTEVSRYFLKRATANGVSMEVAGNVWTQMAKFCEYSFCRAHAAGYGVAAYESAYLKAHYPVEYMTSALNNVQGIYPGRVHVWEAKRMGLDVRGPCVNHSGVEFSCEGDAIRMGLGAVKGLSAQAMESIIRERRREAFAGLTDFMERGRVAPTELESLILAGAFDFTEMTRPELVLEARMMHVKMKGVASRRARAELVGASARRGGALFGRQDGPRERVNLADFSIEQKVEYEFEVLECPMSAHPVALARKGTGGEGGGVRSEELSRYVGRGVRMMGILDASRGAHTVNGKVMQFLTMEDETGLFEITLFPEAYRMCRRMLTDAGPYVVQGRAEERYDSISVTAASLRRL